MTTPLRFACLGATIAALTACHPAHTVQLTTPPPPPPLQVTTRSLVALDALGTATLVGVAGDPDYAVRVRVTAPPLQADARPPLDRLLDDSRKPLLTALCGEFEKLRPVVVAQFNCGSHRQ